MSCDGVSDVFRFKHLSRGAAQSKLEARKTHTHTRTHSILHVFLQCTHHKGKSQGHSGSGRMHRTLKQRPRRRDETTSSGKGGKRRNSSEYEKMRKDSEENKTRVMKNKKKMGEAGF